MANNKCRRSHNGIHVSDCHTSQFGQNMQYYSVSVFVLLTLSLRSLFSISSPPSRCRAAARSWFRPSRSIFSLYSISRSLRSQRLSLFAGSPSLGKATSMLVKFPEDGRGIPEAVLDRDEPPERLFLPWLS